MARVVYVSGRYVPYALASVHVEDRGYQFSDGVYEVMEVRSGHLIDEARHMTRLRRSLDELAISMPPRLTGIRIVVRETVRRNAVRDGLVYLQITRGVARRDFAFPKPRVPPSVVCLARSQPRAANEMRAQAGLSVVTVPDIRWKRVDIKTTGLLAQSMARQAAKDAGANEAWMVDADGLVTEGASCNAWIVTSERTLVTRPAAGAILKGITRDVTLAAAARLGLRADERLFSVEEAKSASEAFQTSATGLVMPVVQIDGRSIGDGRPGPVTLSLREAYRDVSDVSIRGRL